jgi:hypothetical protein
MSLKTGKKPKQHDKRDFSLADFLPGSPQLSQLAPPPEYGWGHGNTYADWSMLANGPDPTAPGKAGEEGCGDCVVASAEHETMEFLTDSGRDVLEVASLFDGSTAVEDYSANGSYDPKTGAGDEGLEIREFLKYRQKTGIVDKKGDRHLIGPYLALEPGNREHLAFALRYFEAVTIGVLIGEAQMDAFLNAEAAGRVPVWSHVRGSEEDGHCIPLMGVPDPRHWAAISWRLRVFLTHPFVEYQCDEAWAYLSPERISAVTGKTYEGATEAQLEEYLHAAARL